MANKKDKHKNTHENINFTLFIACFAIIVLFICVAVFRFEIDSLREDIDNLKGDKEIYNFNVECEGNDIIASVNYSIDSYEIYKKMKEVYDTENCKFYDVLVSGDEQ